MIYRLAAIFVLSAFCATAQGAISLQLAANFDATRTTAYPNGDKPEVVCTINAGYTLLLKGTASGQVCDEGSNTATVTAGGQDEEGDELLAYQSCGTDDCQVSIGVPTISEWSGLVESFTAFGVELCEGTGDSAWCMRAVAYGNGTLRCKAGTPGPDDYNVNGSGGAPAWLMVTHDDSADELRCLQSDDGVTWVTFGTYSRNMAEPAVGGFMAASHDAASTTTALVTNIAFSTTITGYTPPGPPTGSPPTQTSSISNQSGTQGIAFSLNISGNFTGETSYSASGLPGSTGLSFSTSTGVLSGTPAAADVSSSPYNLSMCGVNGDGSTCQSVQFIFSSPPSGGGDVFTVPDVGDTTDSTFDCDNASSGANGSSWASVRTSGSGTTVGAGDTILITSGTRGDTVFTDCRSSDPANNPIIVNKTASSTRLIFNGNNTSAAQGIFQCIDCVGVDFFPDNNWTGHTAGCGANRTAAGISSTPQNDCGVRIQRSGTFADIAVRLKGERRYITFQNIEIDGEWSGVASSNTAISNGFAFNDQQYCPEAPSQSPTNINDTSTNWVEHLTIRNVYVHDTRGPSTYIGLNIPIGCDNNPNTSASQEPILTLPNQRHILVEESYFANSGSNGIHIKRCPGSDPTSCVARYNYIRNIGGSDSTSAQGANNRPIAFYEASGTAYGNVVDATIADDPEGPGIVCAIQHRPASFGTQSCHFYNNLVFDTRGHGLQAVRSGSSGQTGTTAGMQIIWEYNTLENVATASGNCINAAGSVNASGSVVRNNICAGGDTNIATSVTTTNNRTGTSAAQNFNDLAGEDYRLTSSSPARNQGTSAGCPSEDMAGVTRPQGSACDQGAFEFDE